MLEEFIKYCKENGIDIEVVDSEDYDTFEKIFGCSFIKEYNND